MERTKQGGVIKGAAQIAAGGFLAKLIGAAYRIPLTNLLGGEGVGLYQLVYPVYCLLLTVSATGIPSSLAKLVAERQASGKSVAPLFSTAMRLFLCIGAVGTLLMAALAPVLSALQGERGLLFGYFALAPSVLLTSAISVFRGYFQGQGNMLPTATSEVMEQLVKVGVGLLFAWLFRANLYLAVTAVLFAVSVSEGVTALYLWARFRRSRPLPSVGERVPARRVLALSLPVTLSSLLLPLSGLVDSVALVRIMRGYAENAVALYGLFSGGAVTIINLPVSVCYGLAAATVPAVAADRAGAKKRIFKSLGLTLALSAVAAVGLYLFAGTAVGLIFRSLRADERQILTALVRVYSLSAVTLSATQTLSASLTALGKPLRSAIAMGVAVALKTGLGILLVHNPTLSVFGAAIAANAGYLLSFLLDLIFVLK